MRVFEPDKPYNLPTIKYDESILTKEVLFELVEARAALAELKGANSELHNPFALISPPALIKEAITSNAIEDIHTTVESVMQEVANPDQLNKEANKEVLNYREALINGFFDKLPVSTRLVLETHKRIIPKTGGSYRHQQNSIRNMSTGEIIYTPPIASEVNRLMGNLEMFLHDDNGDPLIKAIMAHYQFEAIHPFGDGNGRVGRVLFVLYLCEQGLLKWPALFLSGYLLANRGEYYKRLLEITSEGNWSDYLIFMLRGITEQAKKTHELSKKALGTSSMLQEKIKEMPGHAQASDVVEALFWFPYVHASLLASELKIDFTTARKYLLRLEEAGILSDKGKSGRFHIYVCEEIRSLYQ